MDQSGTLVPLSAGEFRDEWKALRERYPQDFAATELEIGAWNRRQLESRLKSNVGISPRTP